MGVVKAYKLDKVLIPVDQAKVVDAYQCPWTRKVFPTKKAYIKHLSLYRINHIHHKIHKQTFITFRDKFNSLPDFESVIKWIEDNSIWFAINAKNNYGWVDRDKFVIPTDFKIKINEFSVKYDENTSNSHCCPRNGKTNWGGNKPGVPRGYPGWRGGIEYSVSHEILGGVVNLFNNTGIYTGTGGGGRTKSRYEITLFAADWPALRDDYISRRVESILVDEYFKNNLRFNYKS